VDNAEVASALAEVADLLELSGENPFKARAYRRVAEVVDRLGEPLEEHERSGRLRELPGIGERIAKTIGELLHTGTCAERDRLLRMVPAGLPELLRLEGVGPQTAATVWRELRIADVESLEKAARDGRLALLPRLGAQRAKAILQAVERRRKRAGRMPVATAYVHAQSLLARLRRVPGVVLAEACGSLRRRCETVGDLDLLVAARDAAPVVRAFVSMPGVTAVRAEGPTRCAVRLRDGLSADLRVVAPESAGAALHYFTGSRSHNIAVRLRALRRGFKLNEYGVFDREGRRVSGAEETDVFEAAGLSWSDPELREDAGEVEAARSGTLPRLVRDEDLQGDLHVHSDASSDGRSTLEEIVREAARLGRRYVAITDHSRSRPLGLDAEALARHAKTVRAFDTQGGPRLLAGVEVDIRSDGTLDLPAPLLASLDWVVASIHTRLQDPRGALTLRVIRAIRSGVVDVIGHPTGRRIGYRDASDLDLERVLEEAARAGVALEVNAQPDRMDLNDRSCRLAAQAGVMLVVSSDAHVAAHLSNLRCGVWSARRGWLEARHVLNTRDADELLERRAHRMAHARPEPAEQPSLF